MRRVVSREATTRPHLLGEVSEGFKQSKGRARDTRARDARETSSLARLAHSLLEEVEQGLTDNLTYE